jgi:hypothetical protein
MSTISNPRKSVYGTTPLQYTCVVKWRMNQTDSSEAPSKLDKIYKVLETALVSEIILFIFGGVFVTSFSPYAMWVFYGAVIPWSILVTIVLLLIVRHIRNRRALWALYGPD